MSNVDFEYLPHESFDLPSFTSQKRKEDVLKQKNYSQWAISGQKFVPMKGTVDEIKSGCYEIEPMNRGEAPVFFEEVPLNTEDLIRFPQSKFETVVEEIRNFWEKEEMFRDFDLAFKRGILLHGIPGTGKTCLIKLIMKDVIENDGIVIKFDRVGPFKKGIRIFREIHPDKPIVVVMEDLDKIIENNNESSVLNILDGVTKIEKVVFLATTNYPEELEDTITNRPSRFDKTYEIGNLNEKSRRIYFKFLFNKTDRDGIEKQSYDIDQWVKDTENFTISHLHELFVAVVILEDDYDECLEKLRKMREDTLKNTSNNNDFF